MAVCREEDKPHSWWRKKENKFRSFVPHKEKHPVIEDALSENLMWKYSMKYTMMRGFGRVLNSAVITWVGQIK